MNSDVIDNLEEFVKTIPILTDKEIVEHTVYFFNEELQNMCNHPATQFEACLRLEYNVRKYKNYLT
jgi:hypothetical protein